MAMYDTNRTSSLSLEISARISRAVSVLMTGFADLRAARRTRAALSNLTDSQLEDIGLCRGDIAAYF